MPEDLFKGKDRPENDPKKPSETISFIVSGGVIFYFRVSDINAEGPDSTIELKTAWTVTMQIIPVQDVALRIVPQVINIMTAYSNLNLSYSGSGDLPDNSSIHQSIMESDRGFDS